MWLTNKIVVKEIPMRLDKYLCECNIGSRSQVKVYVRQGLVSVNGEAVRSPDIKIDELHDLIEYRGAKLQYSRYRYYMLNKPRGVVSATRDNTASTVLELLPAKLRKDLFPVGRLDKDTEGLLLLTNDGGLAHELLSPRKHVDKTYLVQTASPLSREDIQALESGVDIGEEKRTRAATVKILDQNRMLLTIHEGRYHQVKRMLQAVSNEVLTLKRIRFGNLVLDEELEAGEYRELTDLEVQRLHER